MAITELKAIELADLFSTLSDASRVRIISALLEQEMSVGVLAAKLRHERIGGLASAAGLAADAADSRPQGRATGLLQPGR